MPQRMIVSETRNQIHLMNVGICLVGVALGIAVAYLNAQPNDPYPLDLRIFDRIGNGATCGASIAFLAMLVSQWMLHGRRESLWSGEWIGLTTASLILSNGLGLRHFILCLILCALWTAAVAILLTRPFTRHRPGRLTASHNTEIGGLLLTAMTVPFIAWQYAHGIAYL